MTPLDLNPALFLLVSGLAALRTWRLLHRERLSDAITWAFATALAKAARLLPTKAREPFVDTAVEGWTCPWCSGFWIGGGWIATGLAWSDTLAWQLIALALAVNYVAGHVGSRLDA